MLTTFSPFVPSTWLPALLAVIKRAGMALLKNLEAAVQGVVEKPPQITLPRISMPQLPRIDFVAPVRWVWHAFWWLVRKTLKALFLGFASLIAVIAYAFGPFGWWSLIIVPFVLIFVAPFALLIWLMIWAGVLTTRFCSWVVRSILHKPADKKAQKALHQSHWFSRNLFILGLILLFVWLPAGLIAIICSILYTIVDQAVFWWGRKPAPQPIFTEEA